MLYLISFADDRTMSRSTDLIRIVSDFLAASGAFLHRNRHALYTLAMLTFPICAGKQIINLVQMANASRSLVEIDIEDRIAAREAAAAAAAAHGTKKKE